MTAQSLYLQQANTLRSNKEQWTVYESQGHCVVLAGPGSGKTKTLTLKLARMLSEDVCFPRGIACITYSNQCVRELKKRLKILGITDGRNVSISTLHGFCLKHIVGPYAQMAGESKLNPIQIASSSESDRLKNQAWEKIIGASSRFAGVRFDKYRRMILDRDSDEWKNKDSEIAQVIEYYETLLEQAGLIDFDGIVLTGLQLVKKYPWVRKALVARFPVLVVDEYQDLGYPLDQIVRLLCFDGGMRLLAVGDPDQSIYGFTGAAPNLLQELSERDDVETIRLKLNYRCGEKIIKASTVALAEERDFHSSGSNPGEIFFKCCKDGLADQAKFICDYIIPQALKNKPERKIGDIAILYIDKNDGDIIANAVTQKGWNFIRVDGNSPYQASPVTYWLEDCAAWCSGGWKTGKVSLAEIIYRWLNFNERANSPSAQRLLQTQLVKFLYENRESGRSLNKWLSGFMQSGLKDAIELEPRLRDDKEKVCQLIKATENGKELEKVTVSFFGGQGGSPEHLNLTTLHSAKGLEYDVVIMPGLEQGRIPWANDSGDTLKEKRRLFYVGLTRARHEVYLFCSGWFCGNRGRQELGVSIFVQEVYHALEKG